MNRIRHITVTLDRDYREDDAVPIIEALQMIRGVSEVTPRDVTLDESLARSSVRSELYGQLLTLVQELFYPEDKKR